MARAVDADIGSMADELTLEQALTVDRLDACNRAVRGAVPFTLGAIGIVVVALGDSVSWTRKLVWIAVMVSAGSFAFAIAVEYGRRRHSGPVLRWRIGLVGSAAIGFGWGSIALVALPPANQGGLRGLVLVFATGISAVTVLSTAASRGRFFALNLPMTALLAGVYIGSSDPTTRLLGLAVPLYVAVMAVVHGQVHDIVLTNMRLRHELHDAALRDVLTGILNRRAFTTTLDAAVAQSSRSGELIGVLYLDVDRFKTINDRYGHETGDAALVEVARRLRGLLRQGDSCARLGGDEFAVLLRGLSAPDDLQEIAQRVVTELSKPCDLAGETLSIGVSVGATYFAGRGDGSTLLRESDAAQYRAKRAGGRRAVAAWCDLDPLAGSPTLRRSAS